jgi:hypothetical protein
MDNVCWGSGIWGQGIWGGRSTGVTYFGSTTDALTRSFEVTQRKKKLLNIKNLLEAA